MRYDTAPYCEPCMNVGFETNSSWCRCTGREMTAEVAKPKPGREEHLASAGFGLVRFREMGARIREMDLAPA
jgi:hypothetical protein